MGAGEALGVGHPKRWLISFAVWLLTTFMAYKLVGNSDELLNSGIVAGCGITAAGLIFIMLLLWRMITIPPALDANARSRIRELELVVNAPKPALGPIVMNIEKLADVAGEQVEYASIDDPSGFYTLLNKAREYLAETLTEEWLDCFDLEFAAAKEGNIIPHYYFERLESWLDKCANRIDEECLLPIQRPAGLTGQC
jgi:hypothetical protein